MQINGSQIMIECLLEQGVDTIFGYPGGSILNVYDELYRYQDRIRHVLTSHEQELPMRQTVMPEQQEKLACVWQRADREQRT